MADQLGRHRIGADTRRTVQQTVLRVARLHVAEDLSARGKSVTAGVEATTTLTSFCSSGDVLLDSMAQGTSNFLSAVI